MAQLPPRGLWHTTAGVRNLPLATWLGRAVDPLPSDESDPVGQQVVRRYLAAYGPAPTADIRSWYGLAGLPAAVDAVREELVGFRDERGRELLDLPDASRPHPDTPAPVRFLPAFDNAILGYRDRSRIIDDAHLGLSVAGQRAVLVDGRVSATWTVRDRQLDITPLRVLSVPEQEDVHAEAEALTAFLNEDILSERRHRARTNNSRQRLKTRPSADRAPSVGLGVGLRRHSAGRASASLPVARPSRRCRTAAAVSASG